MDVWGFIGKVVASLGGVGAITLLLAHWLSKRWADRLYLKWKHGYDRDIEELRSRFTARLELLGAAIASASASYIAAQEHRLKAVEKLWATILQLRDYIGPFILLYQILDPDEYQDVLSNPKVSKLVPQLREKEFYDGFRNIFETVEQHRPFLGERLWVLFWVYRALTGRVAYKVIVGRDNGHIYPWDLNLKGQPDYLSNLLRTVLSEDELKSIITTKVGAPQMAMSLLEQKILIEADHRVSGSSAAEISLSEGQRLAETLRQAEQAISSKG